MGIVVCKGNPGYGESALLWICRTLQLVIKTVSLKETVKLKSNETMKNITLNLKIYRTIKLGFVEPNGFISISVFPCLFHPR